MRKFGLLLACALAGVAGTVSPSAAITNGVVNNGRHPNVVALVAPVVLTPLIALRKVSYSSAA